MHISDLCISSRALVTVGIAAMIQIDREIRDSIIFSRRALEMRFGATAESVDGDLVGADCASAPVVIADFDLDWPGVSSCIVQVALD